MLMQGDQMYVPNVEELKKEILDEAHISAYAMHPGNTKMLMLTERNHLGYYSHFRYLSGNGKISQWRSTSCLAREMAMTYHGVPVSIIYDLDPRFTSKLWVAFQEALGSRLLYSIAYHSQTDRQIQTLKDMLRSSVLQFGDAWHKRLPLIELAYNNSFYSSIAQDRQKSIADGHSTYKVYKFGDWVFLKLSPCKDVVRFRKKGKLSPRYIGLHYIIERVGEVTYPLDLPLELSRVHNVFHMSMLQRYVYDPSHVIPPQPLEINSDLTYDEVLVMILDWKDKVLRNKIIRMVKVMWRNHSVEEAT
ncbi:uncharacterized protein LOC126609334 [Malus sylvestris]|uniref:uncharacterized protein LOC126609334 n=1 Tax=Malus sylvestris TaxID=3752 RepID=UPI0021ABC3BC|nr:uncharacterized protein LOC126609334 [Malus sylvestris]